MAVTARTATLAEAAAVVTEVWPNYDVYQTRTVGRFPSSCSPS